MHKLKIKKQMASQKLLSQMAALKGDFKSMDNL
jgi:hypothetical protein